MKKNLFLLVFSILCFSACRTKVDEPKPLNGGNTNSPGDVTEVKRDYHPGFIIQSARLPDGDVIAIGTDASGVPALMRFLTASGNSEMIRSFGDTLLGTFMGLGMDTFGHVKICSSKDGVLGLITTDLKGNLLEFRMIAEAGPGKKYQIAVPPDGTPLTGMSLDASGGEDLAILFGGRFNFVEKFPAPGHQEIASMLLTDNGAFVISATSTNTVAAPGKMYILNLSYGPGLRVISSSLAGGHNTVKKSIVTRGGEILTCGGSSINGKCSGFLAKTNVAGALLWHKEYAADSNIIFTAIAEDADGYLAAGSIFGSGPQQGTEPVLIKTDASGKELWRKTFGVKPGQVEEIEAVYKRVDGSVILIGNCTDATTSARKYFVLRVDAVAH